jgi:hypothetical protein
MRTAAASSSAVEGIRKPFSVEPKLLDAGIHVGGKTCSGSSAELQLNCAMRQIAVA